MSTYDTTFIQNLKDIINTGTTCQSRAVWEDGTPANVTKMFGLVNRYNSKLENIPPIGTLRKFNALNCIDEMLWMWQKKSCNVHDLKSHIWDKWADDAGSIGKSYGFQIATQLRLAQHLEEIPKENETDEQKYRPVTALLDQIDYVRHELLFNPLSRRIVTDVYNIPDLAYMHLDPCVYSCVWNVTVAKDVTPDENGEVKEDNYRPVLNLIINQRSQDMIVANNWNIFQYWVLLNILAAEANMIPGEIVHVIADAHIYDKHMDIAKEMIEDYDNGLAKGDCTIKLNNFKNFYEVKLEDFEINGYEYVKDIKNIPVAV